MRQAAKLAEDLQLQFLWHLRQLGGCDGRENNLECLHLFSIYDIRFTRRLQ